MVSWDKILSGFDTEDETINFGSQPIVESGTSIYEISTVATIQSNEQVTQEPCVSATIQHSLLCVKIDNSIVIFENETCEKIAFNYNFDSLITCYAVSKDKCFLFVVIRTGTLHCFHLPTRQQVLLQIEVPSLSGSQLLLENDLTVIKICLREEDAAIDVILVTDNGGIYKTSKVESFFDYFNSMNNQKSMAQTDTLHFEQLKRFDKYQIKYVADVKMTELSLILSSAQTLFLWPSEKRCDLSTMPYKYTKVEFLKNYAAMICLRTDKKLSIVCPQTLIGVNVYDSSVSDFTVIDNRGNNDIQIIVLTMAANRPNVRVLRIISVPGFEQKLEIQVPNSTYLVENLGVHNDTTFLEGIANHTGMTHTIRIKILTEIDHKNRLAKLLKKRRFNEAEAFAEKYSLSLESIYYAKASFLLSQLNSWTMESCNPTDFTALIATLDKIQNVQNIINCCHRVILPDCKQMKTLFFYIRRRILQYTKSSTQNDVQLNFLPNINNTLERLETFEMICNFELHNESSKEKTMKEWIRFSQVNLLEECKNQLRMGSLEAAALIWTRHLPTIMKDVSLKTVQDILESIPDLPIKLLLSWLSHFIPSLVYMLPDVLNNVISWGCKKIKSLEACHYTKWPQIGIDFATKFLNLLKYEAGLFSSENQRIFIGQNTSLKQFMVLFQALCDLHELKTNHKILLSLRAYLGDPIEVTHLILNKVYVDKIPELVNKFLRQYMLNNSLQNDHVFSTYIKKVLRNSRSWWSLEEAPWEKRVAIVVDLICGIEVRLQQILDVLKRASVPWSATMKNLADSALTFDHKLAIEIKNEYNCVPVKLILRKYGYERIGISEKLFREIIKQNRDEMVDDIYELTKNDPILRREIMSLCINNYLSKGNLDAPVKILNNLEDSVALFCVERIVNNIYGALTSQKIPNSTENYMNILNWLKNKLQDISTKPDVDSYHCSNIADSIEDVKSLYHLKKHFNISVTLTDFVTKKCAILENYVRVLCNGTERKNLPILTLYDNVTKVAILLKLPKKRGISLLLNATDNIDTLTEFITYRQADFNIAAEECDRINDLCLPILQNREVNVKIVSIMNNMSARAMVSCPNAALNSNLSLSTIWSNLYWETSNRQSLDNPNMKHEETSRKKCKFYSMYTDLAISLDDSLFYLLKDSLMAKAINQGNGSCDFRKILDVHKVSDVNELVMELLKRSQVMQMEHNENILLQIIKALYYCACMSLSTDQVTLSVITSYLLKIASALLRKLVRTKSLDLQLGLCCLFMIPDEEARKWLSDTCKLLQTNYNAHSTTSVLGYEYFRLTKNNELMQPFVYNRIIHYWAHKLSNYSISYKELLLSDTVSKRQILQRIMSYKNDNILPLIQDYCSHFGFSIDDSLMLTYLKILIKTWNPTLTTSSSVGKKELCISQDEVTKLRKKCDEVVTLIQNKEALVQCIGTLLFEINFYYYEVFLILMDISNEKNSDKRNYLYFLQNYTRKGRPTEIEEDAWRQLNVEETTLPLVAEWRLPFLPEIDAWKLIAPELNLKTYMQWLEIAPVLKLQSNIICALAIKQEAHKIWENVDEKETSKQWNLYPRNSSWLTDAKICIERMTGPDALYYGTAALYYVVNHTPPGADQVAAAQECYVCAQRAAATCTMFKDELMDKIKSKYLRFTSEHILRTHDLGKEKYMKLVMNPNALLRELYMDESIPSRYRSTTSYRPDVNSAVDALSKLFSTNLVRLRLELLHEWLQPDLKDGDINQSITETVGTVRASSNNGMHDDNLLRACYMLEYGDIELSANFLIDIVFGDNNEIVRTHEERYRALHVLQSITSPDKLQDLTKRDLNTIKQYMMSLKYLGKLESWGFGVSVNTFTTCSKYELVQIILKTHCHSPQALACLAQMCIDFKLHEYTLWDKILIKMTKLCMVTELRNVLLEIRDIRHIVNCSGYAAGWQVVITEPFKKIDIEPTAEQIDDCVNTLRLLHSCTILHKLRFTSILEYCFQYGQPHLAVALIPFLDDTDKQYVLKSISSMPNICKVIEDLKALSFKGILTVPHSVTILKQSLPKERFENVV